MTPFQLAREHPRLLHLTAADAVESICDHGLLTTADIIDRWAPPGEERERLIAARRDESIRLGPCIVNDNAPLNTKKLAAALDDGLTPADWLRMLNSRVFFFTKEGPLANLIGAAMNTRRPKKTLVIDTRRLADAYGDAVDIVPINSGNTNFAAARRGRSTFAPLLSTDYARWQRQRGMKSPDTIKEVAVRRSIPDIARFILEIRDGGPA